MCKLTEHDVKLIRDLHSEKQRELARIRETLSVRAIAKKFDVHYRTIERILYADGWSNVR